MISYISQFFQLEFFTLGVYHVYAFSLVSDDRLLYDPGLLIEVGVVVFGSILGDNVH